MRKSVSKGLIARLGVLAAATALVGTLATRVTSYEPQNTRQPLDLPSGLAGQEEDEEDEPETITFYGASYEGDGFFWCLDRSCSMEWAGRLTTLQEEITGTINQLGYESEFGIVGFSTGYTRLSPVPLRATPAAKAAAINYVNSLTPAGSTCLAEAGIEMIRIAYLSDKRRKQGIILSDGKPLCEGVLQTGAAQDITSANYQRMPIHTIKIGSEVDSTLQNIAAMNDGTYRLIP